MNEIYKDIQSILALSDIHPADCIKINNLIVELTKENKKLKNKLSKIETLIINHNCDAGDIYYKYNSRFLKSELKQRILEIVYEEKTDYLQSINGSDYNE